MVRDMPLVWTWVGRICWFRLSRKYSEPEKHIWLMSYLEVFQGFLTQQETKICGLECTRDRIYIAMSVWSNVASQTSDRFTWLWDGSYDDDREPRVKLQVSWWIKTRRDEIPSYQRYDTEERLYTCSTFLHLSRLQTFKLSEEHLPS